MGPAVSIWIKLGLPFGLIESLAATIVVGSGYFVGWCWSAKFLYKGSIDVDCFLQLFCEDFVGSS
jgi:hypothetical protein